MPHVLWLRVSSACIVPEYFSPISHYISRVLEWFFRQYLIECVATYPKPLEVVYTAPAALLPDSLHLHSPSYRTSLEDAQRLAVQPLDPGFYFRVMSYLNAGEGVSSEATPKGFDADAHSAPLYVSDTDLLGTLIAFHPGDCKKGIAAATTLWRGWSERSFMDRFVCARLPLRSQLVYGGALWRARAEGLAWGYQSLLGVYDCLGRGALQWSFFQVGMHVCRLVPPGPGEETLKLGSLLGVYAVLTFGWDSLLSIAPSTLQT